MTSVRKATKEDFDHIFPLFQGFATHTQVNPQDWKKIFSPLWSGQREQFGYVLEDGNEAVGFLGTLYSLRMIQGEKREFCNLTSWIVRQDYRSESLSLLFPLMGGKDLTLTNFTASNRVIEVLLRLGFQSLEDHYRMILPLPVARRKYYDHLRSGANSSKAFRVGSLDFPGSSPPALPARPAGILRWALLSGPQSGNKT